MYHWVMHHRRMARKAMQLQEGHGTSVFEFPDEVGRAT
jgi:hypothetical protein